MRGYRLLKKHGRLAVVNNIKGSLSKTGIRGTKIIGEDLLFGDEEFLDEEFFGEDFLEEEFLDDEFLDDFLFETEGVNNGDELFFNEDGQETEDVPFFNFLNIILVISLLIGYYSFKKAV